MSLLGWFGKKRQPEPEPEPMTDEQWELAKAEIRRMWVDPTPRSQRAMALRIIMASGVRYPQEEKSE